MRKNFWILSLLIMAFTMQAQTNDLMIVEYLDTQNGNGGAIKIYNPTSAAINLSNYKVETSNNGGNCLSTTSLSGTLAAGESIIGTFQAYPSNCHSDFTFNTCGWNGDDYVGIKKNGAYVDMINNPTVANTPILGSTFNGLLKTHIIRENSNCVRYTSTSGNLVNSWPTSIQQVPGWKVFPSAGRCIDTTQTYNPQPTVTADTIRICQGDSALIHGTYRDTAGTYTDTLAGQLVCDSVVATTLQVDRFLTQTQDTFICEGDSILLENAWQQKAGVYYDTIFTSAGCDTLRETNLTLISADTVAVNSVICSDTSYSFHGRTLDSAGTYYETLQGKSGCDSVVKLNLSVNPVSDTTTLNPEICPGSTYAFHGRQLDSAGTYFTTLQNTLGCDSVVKAILTLKPGGDTTKLAPVICSDSTYNFNGKILNSSGIYYDTLVSAVGCDSLIEAQLTVLPGGDTSTINPIICGDSTLSFHGRQLDSSGVYYANLQKSNGCDSVVEAVLTVYPDGDTTTIAPSICRGSTYPFHGQQLDSSGIYHTTLHTSNGCDSIVEAVLTVNPGGDTATIAPSVCRGSSYSFNGRQLDSTGTYYDTLSNTFGCDSIVETQLTVIPPDTIVQSPAICAGDTFRFGSQKLTRSGTYFRFKQVSNGCDTVMKAILTVEDQNIATYNRSYCNGDTLQLRGRSFYSDTVVTFRVPNPDAPCDSMITYRVSFEDVKAGFQSQASESNPQKVIFTNTSSGNVRSVWSFGDGTTSSEENPSHIFSSPGSYMVKLYVEGPQKCTDSLVKKVKITEKEDFEVPNIFTPNGDGFNEYFELSHIPQAENFEIEIFNRWGKLMFHSRQSDFKWDGRRNGSVCSEGVYYWVITTEQEVKKGFLTLKK